MTENLDPSSSPQPQISATPSNREELLPPDKVSILWLAKHVPVSWWFGALGVLISAFVIGTRAANLPFVQQLESMFASSPQVEHASSAIPQQERKQAAAEATQHPQADFVQVAHPAMTEDEKQFRFDLRKYIRSSLDADGQAFLQASIGVAHIDSNTKLYKEQKTVEAANMLIDAALRSRYIPAFRALMDNADKPVDQFDIQQLKANLKEYYFAYEEAKILFKHYLYLSGQDPNQQNGMTRWLDANARAVQASKDLMSHPLAQKHEVGGYFVPASQRFSDYTAKLKEQ